MFGVSISISYPPQDRIISRWRDIKNPRGITLYLNNVSKKFENTLAPFGTFVKTLQDAQMKIRFAQGGIETGKFSFVDSPWVPLSAYTIRQREKRGSFPGDGLIDNQPILRETGRGRRNIGMTSNRVNKVQDGRVEIRHGVKAGTPHMKKHQDGFQAQLGSRTVHIPARPFVGLSPYLIEAMTKQLHKEIKRVIR